MRKMTTVFLLLLICVVVLVTGSNKPRQRWDIGRFVKTASYYNALLPRLPFTSRLEKTKIQINPGNIIWSSPTAQINKSINKGTKAQANVEWGPLDDVVMGGVSKSDFEPGDIFQGEWRGNVTTENNGGFVGIRTKLFRKPFDLSSCSGILLRVKGDGNRYKCILRDDEDWNGVAWSFSFDTAPNNRPITIKVPFTSLKPTKFARILPSMRSFDSGKVTAIQLSLSKFEYDGSLNPKFSEGPFELNIEAIESY